MIEIPKAKKQRWANKPFSKSEFAIPQILGLILSVRKSHIFMSNPQIANQQISRKYCKTLFQNSPITLKFVFLTRFFYVQFWIREWYAIFVRRQILHLRTEVKSAYHKTDLVRKSHIRKVSRLRKVHKSNKKAKNIQKKNKSLSIVSLVHTFINANRGSQSASKQVCRKRKVFAPPLLWSTFCRNNPFPFFTK